MVRILFVLITTAVALWTFIGPVLADSCYEVQQRVDRNQEALGANTLDKPETHKIQERLKKDRETLQEMRCNELFKKQEQE